jgi:hypothetical protein
MLELKDKILNRMGVAEAMGHRATESARRLQQAADKHHDAANAEIADLAKQIQAKGIGQDEELEQRYCRALVTRSHMIQAGHLSQQDAGKMPEVGGKLEKGRLAKLEAAGQGAMNFEEQEHPRAEEGSNGQYKPGEFVPKEHRQEAAQAAEENGFPGLAEAHKEGSTSEPWKQTKADYMTARPLPPEDHDWPQKGDFPFVKTDNGAIYVDKNPAHSTHIRFAEKLGIPAERIVSGGFLRDGELDDMGPRSDAGRYGDQMRAQRRTEHRRAVSQAVAKGEKVPEEVLSDYPDLKKKEETPEEDWKKNGVRSKSFKSWFGDWEKDPENASKVVDAETGEPQDTEPVPVYHGTWTPDKFSAFDPDKLGQSIRHPTCALGFFFADTEEIAKGYAGFHTSSRKPKNLNDIAKELYGKDYRYVQDEADRKKIATIHQSQEEVEEETSQPDSRVLTCYLNVRNPKVMSHEEYHTLFHAHQGPNWGTMQSHEREIATRRAGDNMKVLRNQLKFKGHDGIIIEDWDGNGALRETKGQRTYIAFEPTQIKSVDNSGTFDPNDPHMQKAIRRPFIPPDMPRWRNGRPDGDAYLPLNGVEDRYKFRAMVEEMEKGTWKWSKPLIRCGDQLLTGSHRYAAAKVAGTPLELMDVDDVFAEGGLDFKTTWEANAQVWDGWLSNMDYALKCLPDELLAKYGIDLG